jgi:hypothetical protein
MLLFHDHVSRLNLPFRSFPGNFDRVKGPHPDPRMASKALKQVRFPGV